MLLQQLKLRNIRSYEQETITFPEGSILLAGDVGAGKSTLLLALEFALFGVSRPELPAELLLRKGATQGGATLTFFLEGKHITIERGLRKEKDTIKQTPGSITIDGIKKELMPLELKAEMISLLGYPPEFLAKSKNYLFRYTLYAPQEEMKSILEEDAEIRLDTLRKIFNVDKYKVVRENAQLYMKELRDRIRVLEAKVEPLEVVQQDLSGISREKESLLDSLQHHSLHWEAVQRKIEEQQAALEASEQRHHAWLELQRQYQTLIALQQEKGQQLAQLHHQQELREAQLAALPQDRMSKEEVVEQQQQLSREKQELVERHSSLREKRSFLRQQVTDGEQESAVLMAGINSIPEKEQLMYRLREELPQYSLLDERWAASESLFAEVTQHLGRNETLLAESRSVKDKLVSLDVCPLCLQEVREEHRHTIIARETVRIEQAEKLLFEFRKQRQEILRQRQEIRQQQQHFMQQQNLLSRTELELRQLQQQQQRSEQFQEQLARWKGEYQGTVQEIEKLEQEGKLLQLEQALQELQRVLQRLVQRQYLEQQLRDTAVESRKLQQQVLKLDDGIASLHQEFKPQQDFTQEVQQQKQILQDIQVEEKSLAIQQGQLKTQLTTVGKQEEQLLRKAEGLLRQKNALLRAREIHHWLEEFFLKVTSVIEKHVMVGIHRLFNQLFQEWFSVLVRDEEVNSRIDPDFTPLIGFNGHEVLFSQLSGGERTSAALAYRLALNKVINEVIHEIKTKDLLILDEPTDGFSSEQLDKVREVLEKLALRQIILVSHESKIESFVEHVIKIQKEGAASAVVG